MSTLEEHYTTLLQGIRRQGGTVQVYANIPLPLASALDLEPGETVTWKVVDRTHLLLVRLPDRKPLTGVARPAEEKKEEKKKTRRSRESHA
jgi:antitoxin component of MazEF toxin-antitoxin module